MEIVHNFWDSVEGWAGNGGVGEVGGGIVGTKISELLIFLISSFLVSDVSESLI